MANLIGKELGVKVEIIPVTSANRIPYLQTKKADLVISSLGKNPEREKVIDFSAAYAPFFSGVYGTKDLAVTKMEDLAGKTIGATRGAIEEQEVSKMAPSIRDHQALRGQQRDHLGLHFRPGRSDRDRQHDRRRDRGKEHGASAGGEIRDQGFALLCRPEQGRAETARQGQRDHRQGEDPRASSRKISEKWLKAPLPATLM